MLGGARRVLVADEVGLGKTIQAGLIIAELQQRRPGLRALVVVPSALRTQWCDELRSRFQINGLQADVEALITSRDPDEGDELGADRA